MRATVMYGAGDVRVEDVPDPVLREPTDAVVRVLRSCICGSDLWPYGSLPASERGQRMGHEFLGVVADTGADVSGLRAGDLVVAPFVWADNTCDFCRRRRKLEIKPKQPSVKAPAETFTGDAWFDVIARGEEPSRIRVNVVRFAPGARNAWHCHARGQTLHVTDGIGLIQARGGDVIEIRPGDTINTPAGEWHWHGAAPGHFMTHLAMWEGPGEGQGPETLWGNLVTDAEYGAGPGA